MKKIVKILGGVLTGVFLISSFTGCIDREKNNLGQKEVSVMVYDNGGISTSEGSYEDNRWTKWISKESGLNIKWVPINRNQDIEKINTLFASGSAPDVLWHFNIDYVGNLVNQGVISEVDGLVDKYSTTYKKYRDENPELAKYTKFNGKTYAMATKMEEVGRLNLSIWIRQDWLDKLGLSMPKTDVELLNVARAFKDKDPDGNGLNDTIPFAMKEWYDIVPDMYIAGHRWYVNEDGSLEFGFLSDRFEDALQFYKALFDEGLMSAEFAIDKDFSMQKANWVNGRSGILLNNWPSANNEDLMKKDPNAKPVILPPVKTKYGVGGYYKEPLVSKFVMLNSEIKNPDVAMKFLDFMMENGNEKIIFGNEGEHYNLENNIHKTIDFEKYKKELEYANAYVYLNSIIQNPVEAIFKSENDAFSKMMAQQNYESYLVNVNAEFRRDIPRSPDVKEYANLLTEWGMKRDEIRIKTITGGAQYSASWGLQQMRSEWDKLGGQNVNNLVKEWYNANYK